VERKKAQAVALARAAGARRTDAFWGVPYGNTLRRISPTTTWSPGIRMHANDASRAAAACRSAGLLAEYRDGILSVRKPEAAAAGAGAGAGAGTG
jgi:hypothetical protein